MSAEPLRVIRGDSYSWSRKWAEYPASSWTATWYWTGDPAAYAVAATADPEDPDAHLVTLTSAETGAWGEGLYAWGVHLEGPGGESVTIEGGRTTVDLALAQRKGDPRTHGERMLDAIRATLEGKATHDQLSYSLQGTSVGRLAPEDLERWKAIYVSQVDAEHREREARAGRPVKPRTQLLVRM